MKVIYRRITLLSLNDLCPKYTRCNLLIQKLKNHKGFNECFWSLGKFLWFYTFYAERSRHFIRIRLISKYFAIIIIKPLSRLIEHCNSFFRIELTPVFNRNSQLHVVCYKRNVFLYFKYVVDEWFKKDIVSITYFFPIKALDLISFSSIHKTHSAPTSIT